MNKNKTRNIKHALGTSTYFNFDEPNYCTHCKHTMTPLSRSRYAVPGSKYVIISYKCSNHECNEMMIGTYLPSAEDSNKLNLLNFYPNITLESIPDHIAELSQRFSTAFIQANTAEQLGHFELAGAGYRNALEILVKDYGITEKGDDSESVSKLSLYEAIGKYFPEFEFRISADMVRILGNDHTHYERKYEEIDFSIMKAYFNIFLNLVNTNLMVLHPPIDKAHRDQ